MKKYFRVIGYMFLLLIIFALIITTLHYFNIINEKITEILKLGLPVIAFILGGYKMGKGSLKKGWLVGLKLALVTMVIFFLLVWIFHLGFDPKMLIYDTIILISSMIGGMFGINAKKNDKGV